MKDAARPSSKHKANSMPMTLAFSTLSDEEVKKTLAQHRIGLTVEEARKIETLLGRSPSLVEAVIWGIQGSEHCSYKSSRRFLKNFPTTGKHVILGPGQDSGIIAITDGPPGKRWGIVVSHESHNHPSQIVPFEGAATGVGGTVRDVACMGARVIGCMDMLRLGDLQSAETRNIAKEVARGIGGYGNPLGVPNLGGDTVFDAGFNGNCLVNAIAIGVVREDEIISSFVPEDAGTVGYDIVIVGKPTDRSGFGGASFASLSMEEEKKEQNTGAVQEPNPFLERHLLASTYALFDWLADKGKLHQVSFKDLGAGGIVCASVEQVAERGFGAEISLDAVHVSIAGLPAEIIACAETQERFCWICHPSLTQHILDHYNVEWDLPSVAENARASVIGKVTDDGIYRLSYQGTVVCDASAKALTSGLQYHRPTSSPDAQHSELAIRCTGDRIEVDQNGGSFKTTISDAFTAMLGHPNYASKDPFIRHFDKTVIGNSMIEAGEADATVIIPLQDLESHLEGIAHPGWTISDDDRRTGVAFVADGNPRYGKISAYLQGANAAVEAMCNVTAVGATPRALTDCLNYGNPEIPSHLGALEQGVRGIADAAKALVIDGESVPVISGNVSLYNTTADAKAIPPSAIVCCIGVLTDATKAVSMQLKHPDSTLFLIGARRDECGGSAYFEILESMMHAKAETLLGASVPSPDFERIGRDCAFVRKAISAGLIASCHDISDGGLLLALFEMTLPQRKMGGSIGLTVDITALGGSLANDKVLFSQTQGFIVEVAAGKTSSFLIEAQKSGVEVTDIGKSSSAAQFIVQNESVDLLNRPLRQLQEIWASGLEDALGK